MLPFQVFINIWLCSIDVDQYLDSVVKILQHLEVMMNAVNSYYHSTSEGRYSEKLVDFLTKLVSSFCSRLHKERYESPKKKNWIPPNPSEHLLNDQQIIRFCEIVKPAIMNMAMSKRYIEHARNNLQVLDLDSCICIFIKGIQRRMKLGTWVGGGSVESTCPLFKESTLVCFI